VIRGLILKTLHEVWLATLLFGLAILLVLFLLTYILPQLESEIRYILGQLPFVKSMLSALLGIDVQQEMTVQMLQAFVWVHPVVLSLLWAHETHFFARGFPLRRSIAARSISCSASRSLGAPSLCAIR